MLMNCIPYLGHHISHGIPVFSSDVVVISAPSSISPFGPNPFPRTGGRVATRECGTHHKRVQSAVIFAVKTLARLSPVASVSLSEARGTVLLGIFESHTKVRGPSDRVDPNWELDRTKASSGLPPGHPKPAG